jgi:hypothetical protein
MNIKFTIFSIIALILILNIITMIANFFNVSFAIYGPYLLWIVALAIFYVILPKPRIKSIFAN